MGDRRNLPTVEILMVVSQRSLLAKIALLIFISSCGVGHC